MNEILTMKDFYQQTELVLTKGNPESKIQFTGQLLKDFRGKIKN